MTLRRAVVSRIRSNATLFHYALKCYAFAHPPPYRRANMEFEADAWNGISSLHYRGRRMLGEDNSGPYPFREVTHNRYERCPFADERLGLPMNVTNLDSVMPYAADAYRLTTALRNSYIADRCLEDTRFSLVQAYIFSKLATSLPAFLVRRRDRPVRDGEIEPLETAFYMLGTAPFILVRQLIARGDRTVLNPEPKTGEALYALSSESRTLISNRECACPAAPKLIASYFDVIMNGSYRGALRSPAVDRVHERIGDWRRLAEYNIAASRIDLLVLLNRAVVLRLLLELRGEAAQRTAVVVEGMVSALLGPLTLSYVGAPLRSQLHQTLDVAVESLSELLREHGNRQTPVELTGIAAPPERALASMSSEDVAECIREASACTHRACLHDLRVVHEALGTRRWPTLTVDDVLRRTGGLDLVERLRGIG